MLNIKGGKLFGGGNAYKIRIDLCEPVDRAIHTYIGNRCVYFCENAVGGKNADIRGSFTDIAESELMRKFIGISDTVGIGTAVHYIDVAGAAHNHTVLVAAVKPDYRKINFSGGNEQDIADRYAVFVVGNNAGISRKRDLALEGEARTDNYAQYRGVKIEIRTRFGDGHTEDFIAFFYFDEVALTVLGNVFEQQICFIVFGFAVCKALIQWQCVISAVRRRSEEIFLGHRFWRYFLVFFVPRFGDLAQPYDVAHRSAQERRVARSGVYGSTVGRAFVGRA